MTGLVALLFGLLLWQVSCSPPESDGDADGDTDADTDGDADEEAADGDTGECPDDWECCEDRDCSNAIYCDGLEVCDRGRCEPGFPIDCDDGIDCTEDSCNEASNRCFHDPRHEECDDDDPCNGAERCEPNDEHSDEDGCLLGSPVVCDDGDPCTDDYCDEGECLVQLKDSDGDGHGDAECSICEPGLPPDCEVGDDCNDDNPLTYPGADEICDDADDNDCDGLLNYAEEECTVPNDACADAVALASGVTVFSSTRGTTADIESECAADRFLDVAFTFTTAAVRDVEVVVDAIGREDVYVEVMGACGDVATSQRCTWGNVVTQIFRELPAGTYSLVVSTDGEMDFSVTATDSDPAPPPDGDVCDTATDVSAGGTFAGTTAGFEPDYPVSCGDGSWRDAAFALTLTEASALDLRVDAYGHEVAVAVQDDCGDLATERACLTGSPVDGRVRYLPPGTHYIVVKTDIETAFELEVTPTPTAADVCADATSVAVPGTYRGSTFGLAADIDTACGPDLGPDAVMTFTLADEQDVMIDFFSYGLPHTVSLTPACGDPGAEIACDDGTDFQLLARSLAAGTYFLVVTGDRGSEWEVDIDTAPPVARTVAEDRCSGAIDVTGGGSFSGSTVGALADYAMSCGSETDLDVTYEFTLTDARSVDVTATGSAGDVAVGILPSCGLAAAQYACYGPGSPASGHYWRLEPGTYNLVFRTPGEDAFDFDLSFGPPDTVLPYIPPGSGATHLASPSSGSSDDGQYNVPLSPLTFPFNGTTYDSVAVSTNGYIRFGNGSFPSATSYSDTATDIDEVYPAGTAQITWLGDDGYAGTDFAYEIDTGSNRVIITYIDHHRLSTYDDNDVQIILFCDTGSIQISYVDCTFDTGTTSTYHWSIGVSEPAVAGGSLQLHDFTTHPVGAVVSFGPGAIDQFPQHSGPTPYLPLDGRAIFFERAGSGWDVRVHDLPL